MHRKNLQSALYALCMLTGIVLTVIAIWPAPATKHARQSSIYPAATVAPLKGFSADSVFNTGTAKQLDAFPGIGEVLSNRIIEGREVYGTYRLPEDLLLVKGIGPKTLSGIMAVLSEDLVELPPVSE